MNPWGRNIARLFPAALVATACLTGGAAVDSSRAQGVRGADSGGTVAFVMSILGSSRGVVPVPVSDIRATASDRLTAALSRRGLSVVAEDEVIPSMREWRVRGGNSIPRGFLDHLTNDLDVGLVLVVQIVIDQDRLIATARYLDPISAVLLDVSMSETAVDPERDAGDTAWLAATRSACDAIGEARFEVPDAGRGSTLILDTQPVGCSGAVALMAGQALLEYYLEHGRRNLIDPAVTNATLHDNGYSERHIGPEARKLLRETFACSRLIIPQLISYAPAHRSSTQFDAYDELPGQSTAVVTDFAVSLRLVDLDSGAVTGGRDVFLPSPAPIGRFGIPRHETLKTRLTVAAGRVWSDMNNALEDF